jgi:hypothetical protein
MQYRQGRARRRGSRGPRIALVVACALVAGVAPSRAQLPAPAVSVSDRIHVGGYAGVVFNTPPQPSLDKSRITESAASLIVSVLPVTRLAMLAELDAASSTRQNYAGRQDDRRLELERLYAEYTVVDPLRIRVGRFLTPVGQWNENHAEPLTWTSVRPLTTYRSFAKSTTGAMIAGESSLGGHDAGYALYVGGGSWPGERDEVRFTGVLGARAAVEVVPGLWLGGSAAALREARPLTDEEEHEPDDDGDESPEVEDHDHIRDLGTRTLVGGDARFTIGRLEFTGEATLLTPRPGEHAEGGGFAQLVIPAFGPLYAVGRAERFVTRRGEWSTAGTVGLVLRPRNWMALKFERQLTTSSAPRAATGWFASASVLF